MKQRSIYFITILAITLFSLGLRLYAAARLNVDYDEPVYLGASLDYANAIRAGQFKMIAWNQNTYEHPSLYKILYGVVLLTQEPLAKFHISDLPRLAPIVKTEAKQWNMAARYLSVSLGTLAVFVLTAINPLAGLFLGVNSLSVKYTSEVYLEALPLLTSLLSALAYLRWFKQIQKEKPSPRQQIFWLFLSAVFLGATAASKYVYCVVGIAIFVHFLVAVVQKQIPYSAAYLILGWGLLAVLMFFIFNPYLWPHPWERLIKTITFHIGFQNSNIVMLYNYPRWQTILWLFSPASYYNPAPRSAFLIDIDTLIFLLALSGLPRLFQRERFFFYWLMIGLVFLLAWTTKWPQYTLIIMVPFVISAAQGVTTLLELVRKYLFKKQDALSR